MNKVQAAIDVGLSRLKAGGYTPRPSGMVGEGVLGDWPYWQLDEVWPNWRDVPENERDRLQTELYEFLDSYGTDKLGALYEDLMSATAKKIQEMRSRYMMAGTGDAGATMASGPAVFGGGMMNKVQAAAGAPATLTPESNAGGKDWGVIWETYLESRLRPLAARAVADAIAQLKDLNLPISTTAWGSTDINDSDTEQESIMERVQNDLMKLFASPNIDTGQLPVWGAALIRKYGNEYATSLIDAATGLWKGVTSKEIGGGMMTAEDTRLSEVERIAHRLEQRVVQADTDEMIDQRLQASKLPENVRGVVRAQLIGKQVSPEETESFIGLQEGICEKLQTGLAEKAGVTLEGALLPGGEDDTIDGALTKLLESQVG